MGSGILSPAVTAPAARRWPAGRARRASTVIAQATPRPQPPRAAMVDAPEITGEPDLDHAMFW